MAKQTREEWLAGLKVGDAISCTFPGDALPSVGKVERIDRGALGSDGIHASFPNQPHIVTFWDGALSGYPQVLAWMVSTGAGGSVGPRIFISNGELTAEDTHGS